MAAGARMTTSVGGGGVEIAQVRVAMVGGRQHKWPEAAEVVGWLRPTGAWRLDGLGWRRQVRDGGGNW